MKYFDENKVDSKEVDINLEGCTFDNLVQEADEKSKKPISTATNVDVDLGNENLIHDEESFREAEFDSQLAPIVKEKVENAVHQTVAMNNDRLKIAMTATLDEYNSGRLNELRKERRSRKLTKLLWGIGKVVVVVGILMIFVSNKQIRLRAGIIFHETKEFLADILNDTHTESNAVASDFVEELGKKLNDVNTYEVYEEEEGFTIEVQEEE